MKDMIGYVGNRIEFCPFQRVEEEKEGMFEMIFKRIVRASLSPDTSNVWHVCGFVHLSSTDEIGTPAGTPAIHAITI